MHTLVRVEGRKGGRGGREGGREGGRTYLRVALVFDDLADLEESELGRVGLKGDALSPLEHVHEACHLREGGREGGREG